MLCAEAPWPKADPALLVSDTVLMPVQVNGKKRAEITLPRDADAAAVEAAAKADEGVKPFLAGLTVRKVVVVPGRIVTEHKGPVTGVAFTIDSLSIVSVSYDGEVRVIVDCGVPFVAALTRAALDELGLAPGRETWLVIKAHACHILE